MTSSVLSESSEVLSKSSEVFAEEGAHNMPYASSSGASESVLSGSK